MFNNVGSKIKAVATVFTWIGIIASGAMGIVAMSIVKQIGFIGISGFIIGVLVFLLVLALGCLVSWLSSLFIYGFGQLVENSDQLIKLQTNTLLKTNVSDNTSTPNAESSVDLHDEN